MVLLLPAIVTSQPPPPPDSELPEPPPPPDTDPPDTDPPDTDPPDTVPPDPPADTDPPDTVPPDPPDTVPPDPPDTVPPDSPAVAADEFTVSSTAGWQRTPFTLRQFEQFTISYVSGEWTVDSRNFPYVGLEGYTEDIDSQINQGCKYIADWPYGMLMGKVGENGELLRLDHGSPTPLQDGTLFLRIHDNDGCLADNDGSLTIRVTPVAGNPEPQGQPPAAPSNVQAEEIMHEGRLSTKVSWTDNADNELGFVVVDQKTSQEYEADQLPGIGSTGSLILPFVSCFRVFAYNDYGDSPLSDTVCSQPSTAPSPGQSGQSPQITLLGPSPLNHTQGCPFVGAGATATDTEDGDITDSIIITGTENLNKPGQQTLTYSVTDSAGNKDTKTRQVIVFGAIGTAGCLVGKPEGKAPNLIVYVHGCCTNAADVNALRTEFSEAYNKRKEFLLENGGWEIVIWDWSAHTPKDCIYIKDCADKAYKYARDNGSQELVDTINPHSKYGYIHLIAHSAGSKLIDGAAKRLSELKNQENAERPFI